MLRRNNITLQSRLLIAAAQSARLVRRKVCMKTCQKLKKKGTSRKLRPFKLITTNNPPKHLDFTFAFIVSCQEWPAAEDPHVLVGM
jgi:hypothetical protein